MSVLIVSSSNNPLSRSKIAAQQALEWFQQNQVDSQLIQLSEFPLPPFGSQETLETEGFKKLYELTNQATSLIFASPIYNWSICAELKKYVEHIGSTPPDGSRRGAFFDKIITFVMAAGLPHSYMAMGPIALSMMLDFKCIINPYQTYLSNEHWTKEESLTEQAVKSLQKSLEVHWELDNKLKGRSYASTWQI